LRHFPSLPPLAFQLFASKPEIGRHKQSIDCRAVAWHLLVGQTSLAGPDESPGWPDQLYTGGAKMAEVLDVLPDSTVFRRLRIWNAGMGVLHLVQGIAMVALSNAYTLPVYSNFASWNPATRSLEPSAAVLFQIRLGPAVALFMFMSALAHFLVSTVLYKWYVEKLRHKINYVRWYEYAFSSSVMIVLIVMFFGIYDYGALVAIFGLNGMMQMFGLMMELHNQTTKKTNWTSYVLGCIAGGIPWLILASFFIGSLVTSGDKPPTFVFYIAVSIFFFFNIFALNMVLQYKKVGPWRDYLYGERVYILLSLVAKTLLAWQVFAGTLRG
jgi:hypothetical protein